MDVISEVMFSFWKNISPRRIPPLLHHDNNRRHHCNPRSSSLCLYLCLYLCVMYVVFIFIQICSLVCWYVSRI